MPGVKKSSKMLNKSIMSKVWIKVLLTPTMFYLAQFIFKSQIKMQSDYVTLLLGFLMVLVAIGSEIQYLKTKGPVFTAVIDFATAVCLVYLSRWVFTRSFITFNGAVLTGLLVATVEYGQHLWMLRSGQAWISEGSPEADNRAGRRQRNRAIDVKGHDKGRVKSKSRLEKGNQGKKLK